MCGIINLILSDMQVCLAHCGDQIHKNNEELSSIVKFDLRGTADASH